VHLIRLLPDCYRVLLAFRLLDRCNLGFGRLLAVVIDSVECLFDVGIVYDVISIED